MRRALVLVGLLAVGLTIALVVRVNLLRASSHGPAGGSGVIEGVDVNVTSRIATRISAIKVREGDTVKEGDLLVELDCTEPNAALSEAQARLLGSQASFEASQASARSAHHSASAGLENVTASLSQLDALTSQEAQARADSERAEKLFKAGAATRAAFDDARTRHDTLASQLAAQRASEGASRSQAGALNSSGAAAEAQVLVAQRNVDAARMEVTRAEVSVRECSLTAPRNGMVSTRNLEPGEPVVPGSIILTLTDVTEARARFFLPNDALAAAAPGRKVHVMADAYPGQSFEGTIFYVSPRAEFTPRNTQTRKDRERLVYAVEVRIPNADLKLRSGMPVDVAIEGTWQ